MALKVGVVGVGYWGPNYIRNFLACPKTDVVWVCDLLDKNLKKISSQFPQLKYTKDINAVLNDTEIDCIAIATPPLSHYKLIKSALLKDKHVFVAKPLADSSAKVKELITLAKRKKRMVFCDYTFLYHSPVLEIKKLIKKKAIGEPLYFDSIRTNLGLIQKDVNVIWDLAIHDLSILNFCLGYKPKQIFATASKHINSKTEEIAHININYGNHFTAHIHVSWISPVKMRTILLGGTKRMILFDDVEPDEKIKVYDKGVKISEEATVFNPIYRSGEIRIPNLSRQEALINEINDFSEKILRNEISYENMENSLLLIKILEACDKSLKLGKSISL